MGSESNMKLELPRTICISCFTSASFQNVAVQEPKPKAHEYSDPAYSAGYMLAQGENEGVEEEVAAQCHKGIALSLLSALKEVTVDLRDDMLSHRI